MLEGSQGSTSIILHRLQRLGIETPSNLSPNLSRIHEPPRPEYSDSDDYQCDRPIYRPDKDTMVQSCEERLPTIRNRANKELESLARFLIEKKIVADAEKTSQEIYEEALTSLIEGRLSAAVEKDVADQIFKYLARRLIDTAKILLDIFEIDKDEYDARVAGFIVTLLENLKDIKVTLPELEAVESYARVFLTVPQVAQMAMGPVLKSLLMKWRCTAAGEYEMMRVWADSPSWVIDSSRHSHELNPY